MHSSKRWDGEEMEDLIIRSNSILKLRLRDTNIKHAWLDEKHVQRRLDWGGHVARLRKHDPIQTHVQSVQPLELQRDTTCFGPT